MVWGAIFEKEAIDSEGAVGAMVAQYYTTILGKGLLLAGNEAMGALRTLEQDTPIHTAVRKRCWLEDHDLHVLDWPAGSLDLEFIEDLCGYVARNIYKVGKRLKTIGELEGAVFKSFMNIIVDYIKNLFHFMPRCCMSVIERMEAMIDY